MAITTERDQIRLEIGDNDANAPLLQDDEIDSLLAAEGSFWGAAARCCEVISRQFLRKADVRIGRGGTSIVYSTAAKQYADMAAALRKKASGIAAPWSGGLSLSDKATLAQDSDAVQPLFTKTSMNNPWVGTQSSDSLTDDGQQDA